MFYVYDMAILLTISYDCFSLEEAFDLYKVGRFEGFIAECLNNLEILVDENHY